MRLPETEPGEHSVVVIARIVVPGHLEVAHGFCGRRRRFSYGGSDFFQLALDVPWGSRNVGIHVPGPRFRRDALDHGLCSSGASISVDLLDWWQGLGYGFKRLDGTGGLKYRSFRI